MKNNTAKVQPQSKPAFAVPLAGENTPSPSRTSEVEKRMLLVRLSDAASRIREEAALIRQVGFADTGSRLLRILGETVEEQRLALETKGGNSK